MTWHDDDYLDDCDGAPGCCEHEEYGADILSGRATCSMCGHAWYQTKEEIEAEVERIRA